MRRRASLSAVGGPVAAALLGLVLSVGVARPVAAKPACSPPVVLVALDKSGSMNTPIGASQTPKWQVAQAALTGVLAKFQDRIQFGLLVYPFRPAGCLAKTCAHTCDGQADVTFQADMCNMATCCGNWDAMAGKCLDCTGTTDNCWPLVAGQPPVLVAPARYDADAITSHPGFTEAPDALNGTPLCRAFHDGGAYLHANHPSERSFVLLLTDGMETCQDDPASPCKLNNWSEGDAAKDLLDSYDIRTFVIGFGEGVDVPTLTGIAASGGTGAYYQADDLATLSSAFEAIAAEASKEVCDGEDNDCNGLTDDVPDILCGLGVCKHKIPACVGATDNVCDPLLGATAEVCNGLDDDCDGVTDNGVVWVDPDSGGHVLVGAACFPAGGGQGVVACDQLQSVAFCKVLVGPGETAPEEAAEGATEPTAAEPVAGEPSVEPVADVAEEAALHEVAAEVEEAAEPEAEGEPGLDSMPLDADAGAPDVGGPSTKSQGCGCRSGLRASGGPATGDVVTAGLLLAGLMGLRLAARRRVAVRRFSAARAGLERAGTAGTPCSAGSPRTR